jgi:hypothetical protein
MQIPPVGSAMRIVNLKKTPVVGWLAAVYLILFFGLIVPFHHHDDSARHEDECAICAVSNQPFISSDLYRIAILFIILFIIAPDPLFGAFSPRVALHLRSPPAL